MAVMKIIAHRKERLGGETGSQMKRACEDVVYNQVLVTGRGRRSPTQDGTILNLSVGLCFTSLSKGEHSR